MNVLPYENFTIRTYLSIDEVYQRLDSSIEPHKWIRMPFSGSHKPYQGTYSKSEFKVSRIIGYRNSFLPEITGKIEDDLGQTTIDIRMKLHPVVLIFMGIWVSFAGVGFILALVQLGAAIMNPSAPTVNVTGALGGSGVMVMFAGALTVGAFKFESLKSMKFFRDLFEDAGAK